jgi:hypothetical protein
MTNHVQGRGHWALVRGTDAVCVGTTTPRSSRPPQVWPAGPFSQESHPGEQRRFGIRDGCREWREQANFRTQGQSWKLHASMHCSCDRPVQIQSSRCRAAHDGTHGLNVALGSRSREDLSPMPSEVALPASARGAQGTLSTEDNAARQRCAPERYLFRSAGTTVTGPAAQLAPCSCGNWKLHGVGPSSTAKRAGARSLVSPSRPPSTLVAHSSRIRAQRALTMLDQHAASFSW